ncbi:hypothetical protein HZA42_00270 [Candidatus Peregrinibacteria bacterium]|nr:hypothetical protein [Candidatus Peregrinibacteria bacterium]
MKKILLIGAVALITVSMTGCFGSRDRSAASQQEESAAVSPVEIKAETEVLPVKQEAQNSQSSGVVAPPSFQDGDLYLQALAKKDLKLCAKLQSQKLKDRCVTEIKKTARK